MWVEELPNGKFNFRERFKDKKTGKTKKVGHVMDKNTAQARKEAYRTLQEKIKERQNVQEDDYTFGEMFEKYYEFKSKRWAGSTNRAREGYYKSNIQPFPLDDYLLTEINLSDIQEIIDYAQFDGDLSNSTVKGIKSIITGVYTYAAKYYNIDYRPNFRDLDLEEDDTRLEEKMDKYIDSSILKAEIDKMYERMPLHEAEISEVQILTGMRFGEVSSLYESDWTGDQINITKGVKNRQSIRKIDTNDRLNEIIKKRLEMNKILFGKHTKLLFPNTKNKHQHLNLVNGNLKSVHPEYTTHVMRHTHITLLVENGFDLRYIMQRVGHVNPETTLKIYTHISDKMNTVNTEKLNNLL